MADEKDRFGDKLRDLERAREDQWAFEQDRKLVEQMRARIKGGELLCPRCHEPLIERIEHGVTVMACPKTDGAWLDPTTLAHLLTKHR
ncbi:MAG TPA: zf-TFIIB domain-containing protein [Candidatus Binataceae bacterium]|nr:zf-TFIIB domain-containing protein [Candidatus Binataceae bacterium]